MYTFENQYFDFGKVHTILSFTKAMNDGGHTPVGAPGEWPSVWIKNYGKGRVFCSALGHREDVIDPVITVTGDVRQNPPEVALAYQRMLLAGIPWSLKIIDGDVPATVTVDGKVYKNVGIHTRGLSSFMMVPAGEKHSLNLSFDFIE